MVKKKYWLLSAFSIAISTGFISTVSAQNNSLVGIGFENGGVNKIVHRVINYIGSCSGSYETKIIGRFRDQSVSTEDNYRVRLTNLSIPILIDSPPYSDREYEDDNKSEKIKFKFGNKHDKKKFIVKNGINQISFVIYEGDFGNEDMNTIKEGEFQIDISQETREVKRDIEWNNAPRFGCLNQYGNFQELTDINEIKKCPIPVSQKIGRCNGRTIYGDVKPIEIESVK